MIIVKYLLKFLHIIVYRNNLCYTEADEEVCRAVLYFERKQEKKDEISVDKNQGFAEGL